MKKVETYDEIRKKVLDAYFLKNIPFELALAIYCKDIKVAIKIKKSIQSI